MCPKLKKNIVYVHFSKLEECITLVFVERCYLCPVRKSYNPLDPFLYKTLLSKSGCILNNIKILVKNGCFSNKV